MEIREATEDDIPGIIEVLKASLGESSSKKTETVWRYKHYENPFGPSLILLAIEDSKIVGVRAFMRWRWQKNSEIYSAFRAVDTATHPDYQGMGIFKRLTLEALHLGEERKESFVFNTPNDQSKPGYLKMGWVEVANLKVKIMPVLPSFSSPTLETTTTATNFINEISKEVLEKHNFTLEQKSKLFTPKSLEYLEWRYQKNPLQDYIIKSASDYFLAAYVKKHKKIKELRVSEAIFFSRDAGKEINNLVVLMGRKLGAHFISISPNLNCPLPIGISGRFGPVLTVRKMWLNEKKYNEILNFNSWEYSLGDLELF